jgi:hypothetical protein
MKYRPHPQTSFGGTFTSILIPTGKNSQTSDLQTGQSPRESPFTGEIDIPILGYLTKKKKKYYLKSDLFIFSKKKK